MCDYARINSSICVFKLVDTPSVEASFLQGLRYANVSLTHSGVDTVRNKSARTRAPELSRRHVGIVTESIAMLE